MWPQAAVSSTLASAHALARLGGHWCRFVEIAGDRIVHIHAHDNRGQFDDHLPPGDGYVAWPEIRRSLQQIEYAGWIMLELQCPDEPLVRYYARAFDRADRLVNGQI